jgi:hypothetical protein
MQRPIFRQAALDRLSSPEQLDQLIRITSPRSWLALAALIGLIVTVAGWSVSDTIPTDVVGRGILIRGGRILTVAAPSTGQVDMLLVQVGDTVEAGQTVARLRLDRDTTLDVISADPGRVVETSVAPGSSVAAGATLIMLEESAKPLEAVIYMPPEKGKNVQPGMDVQISPANVSREEYGFIRAKVRSVATFPSTFQSMMLVLANEQLVQEFLREGTPLEVRIDLEADLSTPSGYRWSSSDGPPFPVSSGTLAIATITLEEQHPIEFVLPRR